MNARNVSIRLRLTIWYAAAMLVILGIAFVGIYLHMRSKLESMALGNLDDGYTTVEAVLKNSGGDIFDVYHLGHGSMFRVQQKGKILYVTNTWTDAGLEDAAEGAPPQTYHPWQAPGGRHFMVRVGMVPEFDFDLSYANDVTSTRESISNLGAILLAAIPAAIILALAGGHFLAGRAL